MCEKKFKINIFKGIWKSALVYEKNPGNSKVKNINRENCKENCKGSGLTYVYKEKLYMSWRDSKVVRVLALFGNDLGSIPGTLYALLSPPRVTFE